MQYPYDKIRHEVDELLRRSVEAIDAILPGDEVTLSGEVLEVRRGRSLSDPEDSDSGYTHWHIVVRDVEKEQTILATLPSDHSRSEEGCTIGLRGRYRTVPDSIDSSVRLFFEARTLDPTWRSLPTARTKMRRALLEELASFMPCELAKLPESVTIASSRQSAAEEDFRRGLGGAAKHVHIDLAPIPLERGTAAEIAESIRAIAVRSAATDVVVIARGGGRKIMLQRFSDPDVVRAVAALAEQVPVIVAIGHARDHVDAELFAWKNAATPQGAGHVVAREVWGRREGRRREARRPVSVAATSSTAMVTATSRPVLYPMVQVKRTIWSKVVLIFWMSAAAGASWFLRGRLDARAQAVVISPPAATSGGAASVAAPEPKSQLKQRSRNTRAKVRVTDN